jgi:DNA-binding NarL/FixJ family response regulator
MLRHVVLRCLIVDDNEEFLDAACNLLRRERVEIVGVASTAAEAVRLSAQLQPDVALVDVYLGAESGIELARRLAVDHGGPSPAVILISTYSERDLAEVIAGSPAAGFVSKGSLSRAAIHAALGRPDEP